MTSDPQRGLSRRAHWAGGDKLISRLMAEALARPDIVSLAAGFVDQLTLPVEATREAIVAMWSDPVRARAALQYGTTIGHGRRSALQSSLAWRRPMAPMRGESPCLIKLSSLPAAISFCI